MGTVVQGLVRGGRTLVSWRGIGAAWREGGWGFGLRAGALGLGLRAYSMSSAQAYICFQKEYNFFKHYFINFLCQQVTANDMLTEFAFVFKLRVTSRRLHGV